MNKKYCEFCNAELKYLSDKIGGIEIERIFPEICKCEKAQKKEKERQAQKRKEEEIEKERIEKEQYEREMERIIGHSGISSRFVGKGLDDFEITKDNKEAHKIAVDYVKNFKNHNGRGLYIVGNVGVGKSRLACAIATELMQDGVSVICMTMVEMLARIKETFDKEFAYSEAEVLGMYEDVPLLIIDDLGKERATPWSLPIIYKIIDNRYANLMPTIITTNYNEETLKQRMTVEDDMTIRAILDRLIEMNTGIVMGGESWRTR